MKIFTQNVIVLGVENHLMSLIPEMLTPQKVAAMEDLELRSLAEESVGIQETRKLLNSEIKILEDGLSLCRSYTSQRPSSLRPSKGDHRRRASSVSSAVSGQAGEEDL